MAVYTHLGAEELAQLIGAYDVGELVSAKGIAEGVSNSNWLIETTRGRYVLTMYERRIETGDLPFFLGLLDHLSEHGCAVPRTIHDHAGAAYRMVDGKAVALIEFLPGVSPTLPTAAQSRAVGAALAKIHLAGLEFAAERANPLDAGFNCSELEHTDPAALASIDPAMPATVAMARQVSRDWPRDLPQSIIHSDLFPDNVLMLGDEVTGMIDFYFACSDAMAYDLAVTHAAWCFDKRGETYKPDLGRALLEGYESIRPLEPRERHELSLLAQGACLRFVASRTEDWLDTPPDALVTRKDPMDFVRRWLFYAEKGREAFA
ncbi:MAG: homoserine kinase [Erythrobacter sp.]